MLGHGKYKNKFEPSKKQLKDKAKMQYRDGFGFCTLFLNFPLNKFFQNIFLSH